MLYYFNICCDKQSQSEMSMNIAGLRITLGQTSSNASKAIYFLNLEKEKNV